ncbi:MAG: class I SAM-dependent methyltransferase [Bacteroidetes bacterium]|nr:class I SAM-dependent methyltransferase [Bacteroidota bacterium]
MATFIEKRAIITNEHGEQPLWKGYQGAAKTTRSSNQVRTQPTMGNLFTHLAQKTNAQNIIEFGTAFGVSGMYFLAGLKANQKGKLYTFDPNDIWAHLANENLKRINHPYQLTIGTFEENIARVLPQGDKIDIAFVDAIHTREFVMPQLEIVIQYSRPGTLIILDDINFSEDMVQCWRDVSQDNRFSSAVTVGDRVGVVELR